MGAASGQHAPAVEHSSAVEHTSSAQDGSAEVPRSPVHDRPAHAGVSRSSAEDGPAHAEISLSSVEDILHPPGVVHPAPGAHAPGRAGRDLRAAIGVGVLLAGLVVASLFLAPVAFVALAGAAVVVAVWEMGNALAAGGIRMPVVPVAVGSAAMLAAAYLRGPEPLVVAFVLTSLAAMAWRAGEGSHNLVRDACSGVFTTLYVPFLAAFAVLMVREQDGPWRVFVFVLLTVCSDVGGYAAGVLTGRHPMAPRISPKKSWEGFAGSVAACSAMGALVLPLALDGRAWHGAVVGVAVAVTATLGDLGESMVKRDIGIKDMGSLLPGHGGIMDRLDSLLPTAPVVWALLALTVGTTPG
ncbi:MAG: phosphatidate cytidylyltransferase [Actinomycetota bacterium]|nr:phosphatidate cytidylyltransferase [Actinomycetota bacterium]